MKRENEREVPLCKEFFPSLLSFFLSFFLKLEDPPWLPHQPHTDCKTLSVFTGFNIEGCEGVVVDRADQYKGIETTANLPYKVKLEVKSPKNGKLKKVFVHLAKYELETIKTVLHSQDDDNDE